MFLRTGDLGFLQGEELYVAGRIKDLLIIDGRNCYPQDIELTAEQSHPALRAHGAAAFVLDSDSLRLVVICEVEREWKRFDPQEIYAAVHQAICEEYELNLHAIALVKGNAVPKTSSGKVQRQRCRDMYVRDELKVVAQWNVDDDGHLHAGSIDSAPDTPVADEVIGTASPDNDLGHRWSEQTAAIQQWLVEQIACHLSCPPGNIDVRQPFARYGLTSREATELTGKLEHWLGRPLSPALVYAHPTIELLSRHLTGDPEPAGRSRTSNSTLQMEPVAIVGLGCRFPGAPNPRAFWRLLTEGGDAISEVPRDRWDADLVDEQVGYLGASKIRGTVRWGGWLPEIDRFDAEFFGISPREAACIDPQQRILLETAWEALEDAVQPQQELQGSRPGVFVGISTNDYRRHFMDRTSELDPYWSTGNASSIAANRLSYFFNFTGPSMAVDTACSSSLVAVHWACRSLHVGECDLALAGGVNVILSPDISFSFVKGGGLAPDGRCKAFDARANGIVRSEGTAIVVLKRLSQALAEGDPIYAVIRGSAVNQDGRSNGITAPRQSAQEAVVREAWRAAGVSPADAQYMEAHGAGTLLGDVIEANALSNVLREQRPAGTKCAVGSVKTNIGHCEAAAGVAGLIKVALAMKHGQIPPSLHFETPNPNIPFEELPLQVQTELTPWPEAPHRHLGGVSAFGFGGTNAHVVLESAGDPVATKGFSEGEPKPVHLVPLSAATRPALADLASRYHDQLASGPALDAQAFATFCRSVSTRRSHLDHRAALLANGASELEEQLQAIATGEEHPRVLVGQVPRDRSPRLAFVFSGHGGQWRGMHQALSDRFPEFRERIEQCDALLREHADWSLLAAWNDSAPDSRLERGDIEVVQTSIFAFQVALAETWKSWGVVPDAVIGHSMGEIAAACVAGALDLPQALRVMVHRSRLLQRAFDESSKDGAMAAIRVSAEQAMPLLEGIEDHVSIAVCNSPKYTVLAGKADVLKDLLKKLRQHKIGGRLMKVPGAAHTPELEPTGRTLETALEGLQPHPTSIPFYSTIQGERVRGENLNAAYWGSSVCRSVQFASAINHLLDDNYRLFLELGPHPLLCAAVMQCAQHRDRPSAAVPSLRNNDHDLDAIQEAVGTMYVLGRDVSWKQVHSGGLPSWISLPTYPWQRQRCWMAPSTNGKPKRKGTTSVQAGSGNDAGHPLLGSEIEVAIDPHVHCWNARVSVERVPYLREYQMQNVVAFPVAACLEAVAATAQESLGRTCHVIEHIRFDQALVLDAQAEETVQLVLETNESETADFHLFSRQQNGSWQLHTSGCVRALHSEDRASPPAADVSQHMEASPSASREKPLGSPAKPQQGHWVNGEWTHTREVWRGANQVLARTDLLDEVTRNAHGYAMHPVLLDTCLAILGSAAGQAPCSSVRYVPTAVGQLRWYSNPRPGGRLWTHAVCESHADGDAETLRGSVQVWDEDLTPVFEVSGLQLRCIAVATSTDDVDPRSTSDASSLIDAEEAVEAEAQRLLKAFRDSDGSQRQDYLRDYLQARIAYTLDTEPQQIDLARPLTLLGIDSLMAMEIKNRVELELNTNVPIATVLEGPTITQLAKILLEQLGSEPTQVVLTEHDHQTMRQGGTEIAAEEAAQLLEQLEELSEQEVDALMQRLSSEKRNEI